MHSEIKIFDNIYWVGGNDRSLDFFENAIPTPDGMSYNSYLVLDNKNILLDGVDSTVKDVFLKNIDYLLKDKTLDYVIINHMEPDHCSVFNDLLLRFPNIKFIGNVKTIKMLQQFYRNIDSSSCIVVKEGDTFSTGTHEFKFYMAPMVHWPEAMVSYESFSKILFSADAFGSFGTYSGCLYHDEVYDKEMYMNETRRYYANIVGKYGPQVNALLNKLSNIELNYICSLHGPIWRKDFDIILNKYKKWANYEAELQSVCIAYASIYGNTKVAAEYLANSLSLRGIENIKVYDISKTHYSYIISEAFKYSHLVFASSTYNNGLFLSTECLLLDYVAHNIQNKNVALIENGTWAPQAGKIMKSILEGAKNTVFIEPIVTVMSTCSDENLLQLDELSKNISDTIK